MVPEPSDEVEEADGRQTQTCPAPGPPPTPAQHDGGRLHAAAARPPPFPGFLSVVSSQFALSSQQSNVVYFRRDVRGERSFSAFIFWCLKFKPIFSI